MALQDQTYYYPIEYSCTDILSYVRRACLSKINCNPVEPGGIYANCDELWNDNLCPGESAFKIPYQCDQLLQFQFHFLDNFNPDPENPVSGWKVDGTGSFIQVRLIDTITGSLITDVAPDIATQWFVGWDGTQSVQQIEIDTALIEALGLTCWRLEFRTFFQSLDFDSEACTQEFGCVPEQGCLVSGGKTDGLVCLRSEGNAPDCFGQTAGVTLPVENFTGTGVFDFDNSLCFRANFFLSGCSFTKEVFGDGVVSSELTNIYTFQLSESIPIWYKAVLVKQFLAAQKVFIDGHEFDIESFTLSNLVTSGRQFLFSADLTATCETDYFCE